MMVILDDRVNGAHPVIQAEMVSLERRGVKVPMANAVVQERKVIQVVPVSRVYLVKVVDLECAVHRVKKVNRLIRTLSSDWSSKVVSVQGESAVKLAIKVPKDRLESEAFPELMALTAPTASQVKREPKGSPVLLLSASQVIPAKKTRVEKMKKPTESVSIGRLNYQVLM